MSSLSDKIRLLLKLIISCVFLIAGMCKVNPYFHLESYNYMDNSFQTTFTPLWQRLVFDIIGHKIHPIVFKYMIGNTELAISILLWGAGNLPLFASFIGFLVMSAAVITHILLKEDYLFPLILGIICIIIFILSFNLNKKERKPKKK